MVHLYSALTILASLGSFASVQACTGPNVNSATLQLVESFEDIDPTGNPTVGYGHLCTKKNCAEVPYSIPLSKANGRKLLAKDLKKAQQCITLKTNSGVKLNANQYGALVSWGFNVGCGNVQSSTLLKRLNKGQSAGKVIREELPKWNKGNGKVIKGLTRRRAAEVTLSKKSTSVKALPACS
ncbi:hypothetical protein G7Z17_g7585 [Cylindrodendrum hubeiense]|uniref:Lysozyme n=1 Tax=Cylindrodendrum hubeiense TaxID=595255 RepID=A0A9P5LE25_9HYPO|nr:hypothetical protein G7Z17_g7585 [Cylindrodendrum hubeiense]